MLETEANDSSLLSEKEYVEHPATATSLQESKAAADKALEAELARESANGAEYWSKK